jgi:D-sedoheptulose 7-phosphate isomerase
MKIETLAQYCIDAINKGNKIIVCGNGGSAAQSQHFVAELVGKYKRERRALPAISLTVDTSILTSIANDYSYDKVFVRQLEALGKAGDVLICLSTSGKSENVNLALEWARKNGLIVCDFERVGETTPEIQENQLCALHELAGIIEEAFL